MKKILLLLTALYSFCFSVPYSQCFESASKYYQVPYALLVAIAKVESNFNPGAVNVNRNRTIDRGIMQINTSWDRYLLRYGIDPRWVWEPCYNIHLGAMVLRHCLNIYGYDWRAVDCYNKGSRARPNSRYVWSVYRAMQKLYVRGN